MNFGEVAEGLGLGALQFGAAKTFLATPAMRDWTANMMRAITSGNSRATEVLTKKLGAIAATEPTYQLEILGIQRVLERAANDNFVTRMVASPNSDNVDQQQHKQAATP
jgi:hypothetical protein